MVTTRGNAEFPQMTRRKYLTAQAILGGANIFLAVEAVASTAMEHPEWDMDELRTWDEWERHGD